MRTIFLYPLICSCVFAIFPVGTLRAEQEYLPVKQVHLLETTIPAKLTQLLMENPEVKFQVKVGPAGQILDSVAVEATHFGLLAKAEEKIKEAAFEPALLDGEPTVGKIVVTVTFFDPVQRAWKRAGIAPLGASVSEAAERKLYEGNKDSYRYGRSKPSELDGPLQILETKLCLVHPPDQPAATGKVHVEYFVDFEGHVHMPQILNSDGDYLTLSVLKTLENTRFSPPRKNGQPTLVSVRQPFNFD